MALHRLLVIVAMECFAVGHTKAQEVMVGHMVRDLSPWGMFLAADLVVKTIMVGLVLAAVITWIICIAKQMELWAARQRLHSALTRIGGAETVLAAEGQFADTREPAARIVRAAADELRVWSGHDAADVKERAALMLSRIEGAAGRRMGRGLGVLASIGATAPFVGLLGTVWGIMNSFIGISNANTTNLAVVAPGIAEALLATALGLVAAIPAVVIYNFLARSIAHYRARLADASALVMTLLSRDLEAMMEMDALARAAE